jgi:hypothetical protein
MEALANSHLGSTLTVLAAGLPICASQLVQWTSRCSRVAPLVLFRSLHAALLVAANAYLSVLSVIRAADEIKFDQQSSNQHTFTVKKLKAAHEADLEEDDL